ncbi:protein phosphatase CheZ, partial [Nostoc sp. NIES-2111]
MQAPRRPFRIEHFGAAQGDAAERSGLNPLGPARALGPRERSAIRAAIATADALRRAARELGEVAADTAAAANAVLGASEEIDLSVDRLRMLAGRGPILPVADEISEQAASVMQACGFQDLTGQRIANVVAILHDMESRLAALREVFSAAGPGTEDEPPPRPAAEPALENGPKLPSDGGHLTQEQV